MDESAYSTLLKYVENTEYTENLTESEKRKLRKQAKHYVSKDKLLYYVSAKGETRRVLAIPTVPLVNISSMSFKYRFRRCMVLLELLYFNACSTVTKFNCNIEILKI
jgi:hypothetical protein